MSKDDHSQEYGSSRFKTRYWSCICWIENMREDWREVLPDLVQLPGFYALHDKDVDSKGEARKPHLHLTLCWDGPTTRKNAKEVANYLSREGAVCCSTANAVQRMRSTYDYAIHATEAAQKAGKYQYPEETRVCFNGFEIGFFEQLSADEKDRIAFDISELILKRKIENIADLQDEILSEWDYSYWVVFKNQNAFFDRLCRGVYLRRTNGKIEVDLAEVDPAMVALSPTITRAADGSRICVCSECGEVKPDWQMVSYGGPDNPNVGVCQSCHYAMENED